MTTANARDALEAVYRTEARRVRATLIRLLGGFDPAEEALHEAFAAAAEQWPRDGVPPNPYGWLVSTGRFRLISRWRRHAQVTGVLPELTAMSEVMTEPPTPDAIQDDELRLLFVCCHPAITPDARIALTLREVGGLTTEEIARAYLTPTPTIAQRIVRAKAKIRDEAIPYEVPTRPELPARLESVLAVVYLIFNEGYAATVGPSLTRPDLSSEAIRLARLLAQLLQPPDDPEALGLLALLLLHDARRVTRVDQAGDLVLLEDQDRTQWDRAQLTEARALLERALASRRVGPYVLQAAIADLHSEAADTTSTDWPQIVALYDVLRRVEPSPVVALNRAVALGMRDGAAAGLDAVEAVLREGALDEYHLAHAARADLQRRLGMIGAARASYQRALELAQQPAEQRFLRQRLEQLATAQAGRS
jgi:RNA polymerase sigma-70 factor, ECF subfamily